MSEVIDHICAIDVIETYPFFKDGYKSPDKRTITDENGREWEIKIEGFEQPINDWNMTMKCSVCGKTITK